MSRRAAARALRRRSSTPARTTSPPAARDRSTCACARGANPDVWPSALARPRRSSAAPHRRRHARRSPATSRSPTCSRRRRAGRAALVLVSLPCPAIPRVPVAGHALVRGEPVRARGPRSLRARSATAIPDLRRLALHQFWPEGYHPLRRDARRRAAISIDAGQPFPFRRVEGEGIFEITVGPVHAGIIEPGHFRFSVEGETIVNLETRLGFVHKGTEKLFETLPFARTPELAERISGDTSVGARARLLPGARGAGRRATCRRGPRWLRAVLLELERLYNHVGDVGMIVNDTGFAFGHAHCFRLREELLAPERARSPATACCAARWCPGGVAGPLRRGRLASARARRRAHRPRSSTRSRASRSTTRWCSSGCRARAGSPTTTARGDAGGGAGGARQRDRRRRAPRRALRRRTASSPCAGACYEPGDVWARTMVRHRRGARGGAADQRLLARTPARRARAAPRSPPLPRGRRTPSCSWRRGAAPSGTGCSPRARRRCARVKVVDPSFRNWPALEYAVLKNIVPDFPLCNKSFNLSYSGNDL